MNNNYLQQYVNTEDSCKILRKKNRINICNDFHANSAGYRTPNMVMREEKNREGCQCSNIRWESTRKRDNREASAILWFQRAYHIRNSTPYFCLWLYNICHDLEVTNWGWQRPARIKIPEFKGSYSALSNRPKCSIASNTCKMEKFRKSIKGKTLVKTFKFSHIWWKMNRNATEMKSCRE